jgi:hypothetical protein
MSVKITKQHIFIIENNLQKVGQSLGRRTDAHREECMILKYNYVPFTQSNTS